LGLIDGHLVILSRIGLRGIDLRRTSLRRISLRRTSPRRISLDRFSLGRIGLSGIDLSGIDLAISDWVGPERSQLDLMLTGNTLIISHRISRSGTGLD
jgi:uncharacterized protein YjbI with pentapeptide repeats